MNAAVLDINLRGESVLPLAEELAARGIPFLFATGYDRDMLPPAWRTVPVCRKPFRTDKLIETLASLCGGRDGGAPPAEGGAASPGADREARPSAPSSQRT